MKFAVAVVLALAVAVNARQLTWSPEQMKAMGYPADPVYEAPAKATATATAYAVAESTAAKPVDPVDKPYYVAKPYYAPVDVAPVEEDPVYYAKPYYYASPADEVDPDMSAPYYYGKPYYAAKPAAVDPEVVDPYHGYYVKPAPEEVDDSVVDPAVACFYKKVSTCDAPEEVSPTCGTEACALPNLCLTVTKTVKKMIEVPVTVCENPKLVCKEIKKECGDTTCAYDETCKVDKVCKKAAVYGYGYPEVAPEAADPVAYPYPYPTGYPEVAPEAGYDDDDSATATAKAYATSNGGDASAAAKAEAKTGSRRMASISSDGAYPAPTGYPTYAAPQADDYAVDPTYGAYKVACKDVYSCEAVDPKVCKTVSHEVCVKKDPSSHPGYFEGYPLGWAPGYVVGQKCGDSICEPGSFCATCEVEVCKDAIMEKDAAQCGYDPKGVPTFCPAGHMCTELCAPVKKYIAVEVEVPVCVDPNDVTYADDVAAVATDCGPHKCFPGYECNTGLVKVCGGIPEEVDPEEEKPHGYYFYYDPSATEDDAEEAMPGYHFYPHNAAGDAAGCGYYAYPQPAIVVDDAAAKPADNFYAYYPTPADPVDDAASVPYYYYPAPADNTATDPYYYPYIPKADATATDPYYYPYIPKADPKPVDPVSYKPWAPVDPVDPVKPWVAPVDPVTVDPVKPWVAPEAPKSKGKTSVTAKADNDGVYVWGESNTQGDASGSFWGGASSGDTSATIDGGSGPGTAKVDCKADAKDGKTAGCDGKATHTD